MGDDLKHVNQAANTVELPSEKRKKSPDVAG
jgi:hypothetical protein